MTLKFPVIHVNAYKIPPNTNISKYKTFCTIAYLGKSLTVHWKIHFNRLYLLIFLRENGNKKYIITLPTQFFSIISEFSIKSTVF